MRQELNKQRGTNQMNTQLNATLANIEFTPDTVQFDGFSLTGMLEADDTVRETYFFNTIADASKVEEALVKSQDLPVGVLLVNPAEYEAAEFGIEGGWGSSLGVVSESGEETQSLSYSLVSLEDEQAAAALQVNVKLSQKNEGREIVLTVQPGSMMVKDCYKGHGHKLDLAAGACWLAQDFATSIYLGASADTKITVRVEPVNNSEESMEFGAALATTLEGVRMAMESELEDAANRCAQVEFQAVALDQAA
jgi:hypothetical protein